MNSFQEVQEEYLRLRRKLLNDLDEWFFDRLKEIYNEEDNIYCECNSSEPFLTGGKYWCKNCTGAIRCVVGDDQHQAELPVNGEFICNAHLREYNE